MDDEIQNFSVGRLQYYRPTTFAETRKVLSEKSWFDSDSPHKDY